MIDSSITHCSNENCSKKDSCLRYTKKRNVLYGQTYLSLTEENAKKINVISIKMNIIKK